MSERRLSYSTVLLHPDQEFPKQDRTVRLLVTYYGRQNADPPQMLDEA
jgi:hypothetical protein